MTGPVMEIQLRRLKEMSAEEKLAVAEELRAAAWSLKRAWLRSVHPDWSDDEVEEEVRLHFRHAGS